MRLGSSSALQQRAHRQQLQRHATCAFGSTSATCDMRLRQHFSDMRHAPSGSTSATCDMRLRQQLQRHATCAFPLHNDNSDRAAGILFRSSFILSEQCGSLFFLFFSFLAYGG
jgi:hypothetical protein